MTESGKLSIVRIPNFIKILVGIVELKGEGNITGISNKMKLSYSTTIRLISRFESKEKWIGINRIDTNPANMRIYLTKKGVDVYDKSIQLLGVIGIKQSDKDFIDKVISQK